MPTMIPPTELDICGTGATPTKANARESFRAWIKAYLNLFGSTGTIADSRNVLIPTAQTGLLDTLASNPAPTGDLSPFGTTVGGKNAMHIQGVGWVKVGGGDPVVTTGVAVTGPVAIPADLSVRNLATSTIGEVWEYISGTGWRVVLNRYSLTQTPANTTTVGSVWKTLATFTCLRGGDLIITGSSYIENSTFSAHALSIYSNATILTSSNAGFVGSAGTLNSGVATHDLSRTNAVVASFKTVTAGEVISLQAITINTSGTASDIRFTVSYIN